MNVRKDYERIHVDRSKVTVQVTRKADRPHSALKKKWLKSIAGISLHGFLRGTPKYNEQWYKDTWLQGCTSMLEDAAARYQYFVPHWFKVQPWGNRQTHAFITVTVLNVRHLSAQSPGSKFCRYTVYTAHVLGCGLYLYFHKMCHITFTSHVNWLSYQEVKRMVEMFDGFFRHL